MAAKTGQVDISTGMAGLTLFDEADKIVKIVFGVSAHGSTTQQDGSDSDGNDSDTQSDDSSADDVDTSSDDNESDCTETSTKAGKDTSKKINVRYIPYAIQRQQTSQHDAHTFLQVIKRMMEKGQDQTSILTRIQGLVSKILAQQNSGKKFNLYSALCQPEPNGELEGIHLLTFCAVTDLDRVIAYFVNLMYHYCFEDTTEAIEYFNRKDQLGNTIFHVIMSCNTLVPVKTFKTLLGFRLKASNESLFDLSITNNAGQHPIHLIMNKPEFRKEFFQIIAERDGSIFELTDNDGNNLLHYLVINCNKICSEMSTPKQKKTHIKKYLKYMLDYGNPNISNCLIKTNNKKETALDMLKNCNDLKHYLKKCLMHALNKAILAIPDDDSTDEEDEDGIPDPPLKAPLHATTNGSSILDIALLTLQDEEVAPLPPREEDELDDPHILEVAPPRPLDVDEPNVNGSPIGPYILEVAPQPPQQVHDLTWTCIECSKTFASEEDIMFHTIQVHEGGLLLVDDSSLLTSLQDKTFVEGFINSVSQFASDPASQ